MIEAERSDSNVPVVLSVSGDTGGIAGLTVVVALRDGATVNSYLDFADNNFKTAGWTTQTVALTDLGGGFYARSGGLNVGAILNLPSSTNHLVLEFTVSGSAVGAVLDTILLRVSSYDQAADLLERPVAIVEPLANHRCLGGLIQKHVNRVRISGLTLEVYDSDDATISYTEALTTSMVAAPVIEANP